MNRHSHLSTWIAAAQANGIMPEPGCPFYVWANGKGRSPLRMIEHAPVEVILEAAAAGLRIPESQDKEFFVALIEKHSNSKAVKRWARSR